MKYAIIDSSSKIVIYTTKDMSVVFHMKRQTSMIDLVYQIVENDVKDLETICHDVNFIDFETKTNSIMISEIVSKYGINYFNKIKLLNYIAKTIEDVNFYCKTIINEYECFPIDSHFMRETINNYDENFKNMIKHIVEHQHIKKINIISLYIKYIDLLICASSIEKVNEIKSDFKFELFDSNHV